MTSGFFRPPHSFPHPPYRLFNTGFTACSLLNSNVSLFATDLRSVGTDVSRVYGVRAHSPALHAFV